MQVRIFFALLQHLKRFAANVIKFLHFSGGLAITIILVNYFTHAGWYFWRWGSSQTYPYAPCHDLEVTPVWQVKFPKFGTEGNFRLLNISKDEVLDIVFGFGTGQIRSFRLKVATCN